MTTTRGSCSTTWPSADALGDRPCPADAPAGLQRRDRRPGSAMPRARPRRSSRRAPSPSSAAPRPPRRVGAVGAVLHDEHAERAAGAQHRHAEERVVDLLARLRQVGEGRMRLRVGEVAAAAPRRRSGRPGRRPTRQRGVVHGLALQAFGRIELERRCRRAAHRREHTSATMLAAMSVTTLSSRCLGADRLRHDLAEFPQEHARPGERPPVGCQADLLDAASRRSTATSACRRNLRFVEFVY